jgi:hypothetical protein
LIFVIIAISVLSLSFIYNMHNKVKSNGTSFIQRRSNTKIVSITKLQNTTGVVLSFCMNYDSLSVFADPMNSPMFCLAAFAIFDTSGNTNYYDDLCLAF